MARACCARWRSDCRCSGRWMSSAVEAASMCPTSASGGSRSADRPARSAPPSDSRGVGQAHWLGSICIGCRKAEAHALWRADRLRASEASLASESNRLAEGRASSVRGRLRAIQARCRRDTRIRLYDAQQRACDRGWSRWARSRRLRDWSGRERQGAGHRRAIGQHAAGAQICAEGTKSQIAREIAVPRWSAGCASRERRSGEPRAK